MTDPAALRLREQIEKLPCPEEKITQIPFIDTAIRYVTSKWMRINLSEVVLSQVVFVIQRHGRPVAVCLPWDTYIALQVAVAEKAIACAKAERSTPKINCSCERPSIIYDTPMPRTDR